MNIRISALLFIASMAVSCHQATPPAPYGPVPNQNQLAWQEMETYAFLHYSLNTYTDEEWGYGNEDPKLFNPKSLDVGQWVRTCKEAGMKGIIFTAKHHCGFCMWPSAYTEYSVKNSPWKEGHGDVVRELAEACRKEGLKFAVYLSPWDRNHAGYATEEYVTYFRNQLRELLTNYGEMFEIWFDGANGGNGWYGGADETRHIGAGYYGWDETFRLVRELQPGICIWGDNVSGADLRWCGTEAGFVGNPCWSTMTVDSTATSKEKLHGVEDGAVWMPAESDVSIRPGWFYHENQDSQVKSLADMMNIYYRTVGRNGALLLNFPITPDGLIHRIDSLRGAEFAGMVRTIFSDNLAAGAKASADNTRGRSRRFSASMALDGDPDTYWATDEGVTTGTLTIDFGKEATFNRFMAQEFTALGQRVCKFRLEAFSDGEWKTLGDELAETGDGLNTIGHKRIVCFPRTTASKIRFTITESKASPLISSIGVYEAPDIEK